MNNQRGCYLEGTDLLSSLDSCRAKEVSANFADEQLMPVQQQIYLGFIEKSLQVSAPQEFIALIRDQVFPLLPHCKFIAGIGRILPDYRIQAYRLLAINFPAEYLEVIRSAGACLQGPIMTRWVKSQKPQLYEPQTDTGSDIDPQWLATYQCYELGNQVAHGMHDLFSDVTSYFSFCDVPGALTTQYDYLSRLLIPHLHMALIQAFVGIPNARTADKPLAPFLTPREKKLLALLLSGNNNRELAHTLQRSEQTIKNQLHALYGKLNVSSRAQAIRRANEFHGERFCLPSAQDALRPLTK